MNVTDYLKQQIKSAKADLAKYERALAALEPSKPAKPKNGKPTAANVREGSLPAAVIDFLTKAGGGKCSAAFIATELGEDKKQVATVCSKLAKQGKVKLEKDGRASYYRARSN